MTQPDQFFIFQQKYNLLQQEHANVLNQLSLTLQTIPNQSLEIQILKDEIARLKEGGTSSKITPPIALKAKAADLEEKVAVIPAEESIPGQTRKA